MLKEKLGLRILMAVLFICMAMVPLQLFARNITLINNMSITVWAGWQGSTIPNGGGVSLSPGASYVLVVPDNWTAARVWGRTYCDASTGYCLTGDCGSKLLCNGAGGVPPATLSEWTLQGSGGIDYYDMSLVDGYNVPMILQNVGGTKRGLGTKYDCGSPACTSDLNASCPSALQVKNSSGTVIACKSACLAFNTDQYCCRNAYGTPATCPPTTYSQTFKAACPDAYSYAYDDQASTYTCIGGNYNVIFGTSTSSSTSTSSTSSSGSVTSISSGSLYEIVNANSGKAMDVAAASTAAGAAVQQYTRNNTTAQRWRITDMGNGLKFIAQCSGMALDCTAWGTANGTKLEQWNDNGGAVQRFGAAYYSNGWKFWTTLTGGRCVDVPGSSTADSVQLQLYDDNGTLAQRWYLYQK
jgi:hypothetical protein